MTSPDVQLARATLILTANRPAPEPAEAEIVQVIDHLGAQEAQSETAEAGR